MKCYVFIAAHAAPHSVARLAIFEFIEVWYNRQRRHSTLGYATPTEYEALAREVLVA